MFSTQTTAREVARNKPAFPLPLELRVKVYEQLLIHPDRFLQPDGFQFGMDETPDHKKGQISTNVLQTCRTFYEEALPILYGKNTIAFHDNDFSKPVLPFPEGHLTMVKRVKIMICPTIYSSAEKMGSFLMTLGTSGAKLVDLSICIYMFEDFDMALRREMGILPPLHLCDQTLMGCYPIVAGLFSLKAVKNLLIKLGDEARFKPGVINTLRAHFMQEGTVFGRSITVESCCSYPHEDLSEDVDEESLCPGCGNTKVDLDKGAVDWNYNDDIFPYEAVDKYLYLCGEQETPQPTKVLDAPESDQSEANIDQSCDHVTYSDNRTE